jgi:hypothetical protein
LLEVNRKTRLFGAVHDIQLADEIEDGQTGFLIERALDEARSRQFRPTCDLFMVGLQGQYLKRP